MGHPAAHLRSTLLVQGLDEGILSFVFASNILQTLESVVDLPDTVGEMKTTRLSKAETRILEQFWKLGTSSVREVLDSLPDDERVAYTTVQTLVYRLEQKGALRKVKKIGNAQLFQAAIDQGEHRRRLVRDLLDLFGGSPRLLVSNLLETRTITLKELRALQSAASSSKSSRARGAKTHG
jgi:predicted transcriptional regulator